MNNPGAGSGGVTRIKRFLLALAAAMAVGAATRYLLIQAPELNWACQVDAAPWWCLPRQGLILVLHAHALGVLSLVAGIVGLAKDDDRWALAAVSLGGAGLWLYGVELSSAGVLLAGLKAARA